MTDAQVALAVGVLSFVGGIIASRVELKKRKPEAVMHMCRVCELHVYTYITGAKQVPPACAFLNTSDYTCRCNPRALMHQKDPREAKVMMATKDALIDNKCYLAMHAESFKLA